MTESVTQIIEQALREACVPHPYAIIDYPNYLNPGDSAIWAGTRIALERLTGRPPSYVSTLRNFDVNKCRDMISGGTIFFLGGGSFGSLYEKHHRMRLRAMDQVAGASIVLLPLSIAEKPGDGGDRSLISETRAVFECCAPLTVFARERNSRRLLRQLYGIESELCPDTAHFCRPPRVRPVTATICLLRRDSEALPRKVMDCTGDDATVSDWHDIKRLALLNRMGKLSPLIPIHGLKLAAFDYLARKKVTAALELLGRGERVVTDRLHGVILASLIERQVIASDNTTGKVASYLATWSQQHPGVSMC